MIFKSKEEIKTFAEAFTDYIFKSKYLITYVQGFSESNHNIHRWHGEKILRTSNINKELKIFRKEMTCGAYGFLQILNIQKL